MKPSGTLTKLRDWATIEEAASYLTTVMKEEVDSSVVLRFALDGHLVMSLNLIDSTPARFGVIQSVSSLPPTESPGFQSPSGFVFTYDYIKINELEAINLETKITKIAGVWDLSMWGAERHIVECEYQRLTGGPDLTYTGSDGVILRSLERGGAVCQLQQERPQDARLSQNPHDYCNYLPANGLPMASALVVKTKVLEGFATNNKPKRKTRMIKHALHEVIRRAAEDLGRDASSTTIYENLMNTKYDIGENIQEVTKKEISWIDDYGKERTPMSRKRFNNFLSEKRNSK